MKVFLGLIAVLACGLAPANAQDSDSGRSGDDDASAAAPTMCVAAHLEESHAEGPNCPTPERFFKRWGITCNPLCYPTYDEFEMETRGACLQILNVLPQWLHCPGAPPQQLVYLGYELRVLRGRLTQEPGRQQPSRLHA